MNRRSNGALDSRRWQQSRSERDDLPLFEDMINAFNTKPVRQPAAERTSAGDAAGQKEADCD